jgi:hypothetical protein
MFTFLHSPILPNMHSHCAKCNARLLINEEWHSGQCIECTQWADVLRMVDAVIDEPIKSPAGFQQGSSNAPVKPPFKPAPDDFAAIMAWIDAYIEQPYEPPTGVIPRPNRAS